jgi:apolipoprotein N-acyltransferase
MSEGAAHHRTAAPPALRPLGLLPLLLTAAGSGALLYLAFPPVNLGALAWVALAPLYWALGRAGGVGRGALAGFVFGLVLVGLFLSYFTMWGALPWVAAVVVMSAVLAVFGALGTLAMRSESPAMRVLGVAGAWALCSLVRANGGPLGFNLDNLAYSQHEQLALIQVCSLVGHVGLGFLIATVNAALAVAAPVVWKRRRGRARGDAASREALAVAVAVYAAVLACVVGGGAALKARPEETGKALKVAAVQGAVRQSTPVTDADLERSLDTYTEMQGSVEPGTDLTVWPESALVGSNTYPGVEAVAEKAARAGKGMLLVGMLENEGEERYNAARLYDTQGRMVDHYRKMDLVVYGEYVPLRKQLPFLERYPIRRTDLLPGPERKVLDVKGVRVAPLICFEGTFSRPARDACRRGAEVLALLNSDAWAEGTQEVAQHSVTAPFRAIEARRYVCRAATTGVSAIYDPYGEALDLIPVGMPGVAAGTVHARRGLSLYHRVGDWPLAVIWLALVLFAALGPRRDRT